MRCYACGWLHPHIHCVVPGGGISPDAKNWIASRKKFFVHVKVLSKVFRKKFLDYLGKAYAKGKVTLEGKLSHLRNLASWQAKLESLKQSDWVVHAKPPFGGPKQALKYLARYTHRVAISNQRLVSMNDGTVTFSWKDYAHGNAQRQMTLSAQEFIRRFLLHVLPSGFQRIRQYGFLANRARGEKLDLCRKLLGEARESETPVGHDLPPLDAEVTAHDSSDGELCPACKAGRLVVVRELTPDRRLAENLFNSHGFDTS